MTNREKLKIFREVQREQMRKLGSMKSEAKAEAARNNGRQSAAKLRTSRDNLIKGAKALAAGASMKHAARVVAHCREATLRAFVEQWNMVPKSKTPPRN